MTQVHTEEWELVFGPWETKDGKQVTEATAIASDTGAFLGRLLSPKVEGEYKTTIETNKTDSTITLFDGGKMIQETNFPTDVLSMPIREFAQYLTTCYHRTKMNKSANSPRV